MFLLATTIVFIVIALFFVQSMVLENETRAFNSLDQYGIANDAKKFILSCYGSLTSDRIMDSTLGNQCLNQITRNGEPLVKGIRFEQLDFLSCPPLEKEIGTTQNCAPDGDRFVYYTATQNGAQTCATRLSVCIYKLGGLHS